MAGWSPLVALEQVRPLRWLLLVLVPFQVWTAGWEAALVVVGTLVVAVAAACLVTLTTRVSDLLDTLVRLLAPLRLAGFDPERAGLALALAVRSVPVIGAAAREVADARRARGSSAASAPWRSRWWCARCGTPSAPARRWPPAGSTTDAPVPAGAGGGRRRRGSTPHPARAATEEHDVELRRA